MSGLNIEQIKELLPQRYPFLMVDRVLEVDLDAEEGAYIRALKNVSINESFFAGHFPGHPVMPGVLTVEAMAQTSGILSMLILGEGRDSKMIQYFAGADKIRFKQPIVPGDQLVLEARFKTHRRGVWKFECRGMVDGKIACTAEITSAERDLEHI